MKSLDKQLADQQQECAQLRSENARLISLLEKHSIAHSVDPPPPALPATPPRANSHLSTEQKIALFRKLFRGRTDVYPIRWEKKDGSKAGYTPACGNEWKVSLCDKKRVKCSECGNRLLLPLTDQVIYDHLAGEHVVGVYPLLADDTCHFLAADFDEADWRDDAKAFAASCHELGVPVAIEISRSGAGAHAWIFFSSAVSARDARRLGSAIISHTCARTRQLKLESYDRLFPNQDTLPKGGFGNLIALPLQKEAREKGFSLFVDDELKPHADQWTFLASVRPMSLADLESTILRATGGGHPLDVAFITEEDEHEPWKRRPIPKKLPGPLPAKLTAVLANQIYFEKAQLPQALMNRLIRLAAFQNPEFYRAQAMRRSTWEFPRVIGCAENYPRHIALPRGCLDAATKLLDENSIGLDLTDERFPGESLSLKFAGQLRPDQEKAVNAMMAHDTGVLCAPTAFGKTVTAAALIARRGVSTLILVHRNELLKQWQERLRVFLGLDKAQLGAIGGGKRKPTGMIDIASMQSLVRNGEVSDEIEYYGHVVIDECHHLAARTYEKLFKAAKARYVLGLTATPIRRDGQHPIIFMQCGPIRHEASRPEAAPRSLTVIPRTLTTQVIGDPAMPIQDIFRQLASSAERSQRIVDDVLHTYRSGRSILVLTERTEHLSTLELALTGQIENLFSLHGRMARKQRAALFEALEALPGDAPRVLLATGRLVGEGFDHPPLDTLMLAMPISWKGTLQQYAGRLHREHASKSEVLIYDYVDTGNVMLERMWDKRQRGYRAMGYRIDTIQDKLC
ncbi:DEAD/DEAH box helicase [Thiobacillus sp.]|uniref:TOTE conflict system archaeo-eukaryotic primase domain-containing protein n=1 Tax=Thiobacillus sp. TaxID=924 RepID=UPI0025DD78F4|nr:DEAD/DEAH box helicase [Thiobacillus sp.]